MDIHQLLAKLQGQEEKDSEKYVLPERDLRRVINKAKEILMEESNVQPVIAPVSICGDIHGQFFDLLNLFRIAGQIKDGNSYIFIGDFVDRGYNSVETMEYLLCLKVAYPERVTLLRGNHESRNITMAYGFFDEIQRKYGNTNPWKLFTDLFDYLPIAALVEGQILCVHGGLSPDMKTLDQIRTIDRKQEIPMDGPFADLMWSDPDDSIDLWAPNMRGAGWLFGKKVVHDFNRLNSLSLICRAHQLVQDGFQYKFDEKLVTVWSAPNYCYRMRNKAIVLKIDENLQRKEVEFTEVEISDKQDPPRKVLPYFL